MDKAWTARQQEEWAELKAKQTHNGQCAAQIVDCDCDWCLRQIVNRMSRANG